jgi:hypothetical protein
MQTPVLIPTNEHSKGAQALIPALHSKKLKDWVNWSLRSRNPPTRVMSNTIATSIQCESDNTDDEPIRPTTDVSDNGLEDESDTDQPADTNSDADQADAFDLGSEDNSDNVPQPQGKKAASKSKKSKPNGSIPKKPRLVRMIRNPKDIT